MTYPAINAAIEYLKSRGTKIPIDILMIAKSNSMELSNENKIELVNHIKAGKINSREYKQVGEYSSIRNELWIAIYDNVYNYLSSTQYVVSFNNVVGVAIGKAYIEAAELGYQDGGGTLPLDEDTLAWAQAETSAQLAYIDSLFSTLKQLRREGDFDAVHEAFEHADGYCNSLDALYNGAKVAGAGNKMLTFEGSDGRESCADCQRYKGQRHRASWWQSHNAVPPSRGFECKGYHCDHRLFDDDGNEFTI